MSDAVKPRRPYRSPVRAQRAHANREAVLAAARRRFLADGYPRTPVSAVAAEAGVSEDLVYLLFGTKRGLLAATLEAAVRGDATGLPVLDQPAPRAVREEPDQHRQIQIFAADHARRVERARPLEEVMRSAAAVDPEIAAQYQAIQTRFLAGLHELVDSVAANGPLRGHLTPQHAAVALWALCGADTHRLLSDNLGADRSTYRAWLTETLTAVLLP